MLQAILRTLSDIADWFKIIHLIKMNAIACLCLQTDEFISTLDKSNGTNRNLSDKERNVFQNITHDLRAALKPSDERNRSILPQDLKTAVTFVEVVAEWVQGVLGCWVSWCGNSSPFTSYHGQSVNVVCHSTHTYVYTMQAVADNYIITLHPTFHS